MTVTAENFCEVVDFVNDIVKRITDALDAKAKENSKMADESEGKFLTKLMYLDNSIAFGDAISIAINQKINFINELHEKTKIQ